MSTTSKAALTLDRKRRTVALHIQASSLKSATSAFNALRVVLEYCMTAEPVWPAPEKKARGGK